MPFTAQLTCIKTKVCYKVCYFQKTNRLIKLTSSGFLVGSSPHHIKKQGISFVMPCFLVRMMGLSSQHAALSPCSAARKRPAAPPLLLLPTKPAALRGPLFWWVHVLIITKIGAPLWGTPILVRMMGLSSHRAALLAGFAVRNPPVASRVLLLPTKPAALRGPFFWWVQVLII